jgi:hypothetical protein
MARNLTEAEAADRLGFKAETLRKWRYLGTGPQYLQGPGVRGWIRYREYLAAANRASQGAAIYGQLFPLLRLLRRFFHNSCPSARVEFLLLLGGLSSG